MTAFFRTAALAAAVLLAGCDLADIDDRANPNGPALDDIINNPTQAALANLAVGVEASSRLGLGTYLVDVGVLGREYWRVSPSDPRFTQDLLGRAESTLDNNTFYITTPWATRYATIRNANTMLVALEGNTTLSDGQKASARGFAKTWIAYQYLLNLNLTGENGIKFIEPGEAEAGPIVGYTESLDRIAALFDEGYADLQGGAAFFFPTSLGQGVPNTTAGYAQINRALAARVDAYRSDWGGVLAALDNSFIDTAAPLTDGAYHTFSTGAGDIQNPFFFPLDGGGDGVLAHPSYVDDIAPDDNRISKVAARTDLRTFDGLTSAYDIDVVASGSAPLSIIRNAELILLRAEARAQTGDTGGAVADLNVIRTAAGLDPYSGDTSQGALVDEVLRQRRYELYAEGHRWLDLRRYGRLGTLPIDRAGDDVFDRFPVPDSDSN
ncbi:RagB/SusD family nutrient uptake outer membrane protein [Rubrivirga sp. IMCC43871]|uniref:RagB/SusD family nutrient uptake outer membrane protein n=1 Tax=Rubrivirga sp. IMCC43871 TaxID=3391575 RepID=UPI003990306C